MSQKRSLEESESGIEPPSKKRRLFTLSKPSWVMSIDESLQNAKHGIHTKFNRIYADKDDHAQFLKYFKAIRDSPIAQTLDIPTMINKEISEYCVGELVECANEECSANINLLQIDLKNPDNAKWRECCKRKLHFCEICKPFTKEYESGVI